MLILFFSTLLLLAFPVKATSAWQENGERKPFAPVRVTFSKGTL